MVLATYEHRHCRLPHRTQLFSGEFVRCPCVTSREATPSNVKRVSWRYLAPEGELQHWLARATRSQPAQAFEGSPRSEKWSARPVDGADKKHSSAGYIPSRLRRSKRLPA